MSPHRCVPHPVAPLPRNRPTVVTATDRRRCGRGVGRWTAAVLAAALLAGGLCPVVAAAAEPKTEAPAAPAAPAARTERTPAEAAPRDGVRVRSASRVLERIWWNQDEMVASLGLKKAQRSEMDARLLAFLEQRQEALRESQELRRRLAEEVGKGLWEEAEGTVAALGRSRGEIGQAEAELVLEVTRLLEPLQRQKLVEGNPRLLSVPWIRASPPTRFGAAPRRSAAGSGENDGG